MPCTDVALRAEPRLVTSLEPRDLAQASGITGGRIPGTGSGRGFRGLRFSVRIPAALSPGSSLSPGRVSPQGPGHGGGARGWTESAVPSAESSHQPVLLSTQCLQGPLPGSISDPLEFVSTRCVLCTECSNRQITTQEMTQRGMGATSGLPVP